ncbi:TPA: hypothetical protein L7414_003299 [Escherichia coli]|nr:hypothetical protein [Escherichia coli]MBB7083133.1 hypothetical protein [Escherichia coli]HBN7234535.1 hypothetical protein [Escherichia coli]HBQ4880332.1 hypothetical protein [Escherichia coli]
MKNEAEKAMWSCKTSDTPWTFSRLLKKAVCAVLPDTELKIENTTKGYSVLSTVDNDTGNKPTNYDPFSFESGLHLDIENLPLIENWDGKLYNLP